MGIQAGPIGEVIPQVQQPWNRELVNELFALPFNDLLYQAQTVHRQHFDPNTVQLSTLLSIKTGACPEDCSYCSQSVRYDTGTEKEALLDIDAVRQAAEAAKASGAGRFCMGAAWRSVKDRDLDKLCEMVESVREMGMETCMTLGMLNEEQARRLSDAGLDYYNHNLDTSENFYPEIISTRSYQDRLDTLQAVRDADIKVCCGGILGLGEAESDRVDLLIELASMQPQPESVPINVLVQMPGTPLDGTDRVDPIDIARTIAVARIMLPGSWIRLSAGRKDMSDELQALCFSAGANSVFYGEKLLTTGNPDYDRDQALFTRLGIKTASKES